MHWFTPFFMHQKGSQVNLFSNHKNKTTYNESLLYYLKAARDWYFLVLYTKTVHWGWEKSPKRLPLPCICRPESSQRASTCGCWCRSPSFPPLCPRSSGSGSLYMQFLPKKGQRVYKQLHFATNYIKASPILRLLDLKRWDHSGQWF